MLVKLYSLMNPRYLKKQLQTPNINSFNLVHKNQNSSLGRTERKSNNGSLNKTPLADVTNNQVEIKSQKKFSVYDLPVQASAEITKNPSRPSSSNISASKWLDTEKEMMEFIMNLKAKKNDQRLSKAKKTQGFEMDERRQETQEYLCNKMLFIKKIEKHQKEAISCFYEGDYQKSFNELSKAEALIRKQKIETVQHQLYINYLYSEFYYKLNDFDKWKAYLLKAKHYVSRVNSNESQSLREYIMNIKALETCLAAHEQHYDKVLHLAEEFTTYDQVSSKIRRRVSHSRITALHKLCKFKEAMETIDQECQALESDNEINNEKQNQQIGKLLALKIELTAEFSSTQRAIELLERIIGFEVVANGTVENFNYYHLKVFQLYSQLLKKDEKNLLKIVFFYEKWIELQPSKKEKLKLQLELFRMYYDLGVYERALELFDEISSENIIYLGPDYLYILASIKHSYGQKKEAVSIMMKIIDLCQDEDSKVLNSYRILEFDLEEQNAALRAEKEKALEKLLKTYHGVNHDSVIELYSDYLKRRGECEKANMLTNKMKKTATFQEFYFNHQKSEKKNSRK